MSPGGVPVIVAGALGFLEAAVRVYQWLRRGYPVTAAYRAPKAKAIAFESHPYALYVKRPHAGGSYPSNNLGYGGTRALAREKLAGTVRIYCVGASTTEEHDPHRGSDSR